MNPHILTTIFNMSIEASILVCIICIFRFVFKKAPKWIICALWGLAGLKLIIPFSFESIVGLLPSKSAVGLTSDGTGIVFANNQVQQVVDNVIVPAVEGVAVSSAEPSAHSGQLLLDILCRLWIAGFAVLLIFAFVSYIRIYRKVKVSIKNDKVCLCDNIDTPFILGIFRPKIYVPSYFDEAKLEPVIAHEKAHIDRKDHWWNPIGYLILSVYWFNPVIWLAYILLCRDIELACDEKVIKNLSAEEIADYSQTLLECSKPVRMVKACPVAFGETGVKQRIKSALSYKKPALWIIISAVIASVAIAVCFGTKHKTGITEYKPQTVTYIYNNEFGDTAKLTLEMSNMKFTFEYSMFSDYLAAGDYSRDEFGNLLLSTDDGKNSYYFHADNNAFRFYAPKSSGMPSFSYTSGSEPQICVPDGALFTEDNTGSISNLCYYFVTLDVDMQDRLVCYEYKNGEVRQIKEMFTSDYTPSLIDSRVKELLGEDREITKINYTELTSDDTESLINEGLSAEIDSASSFIAGDKMIFIRKIKENTCKADLYSYDNNGKPVKIHSFGNERLMAVYDTVDLNPFRDIEGIVSNIILDINKDKNWSGECPAEGHIILGTEENENNFVIYALTSFSSFGFENGYFIDVSGESVPRVITVNKKTGNYKIKEPSDGTDYAKDIKAFFPEELHDRIFNPTGADSESIKIQLSTYAAGYLDSIGRSAEICSYGDIEHILFSDLGISTKIDNAISSMRLPYKQEIGNYEAIENGVRYVYQTDYNKKTRLIKFTKFEFDTNNIAEYIEINSETGKIIKGAAYPEKAPNYHFGKKSGENIEYTTVSITVRDDSAVYKSEETEYADGHEKPESCSVSAYSNLTGTESEKQNLSVKDTEYLNNLLSKQEFAEPYDNLNDVIIRTNGSAVNTVYYYDSGSGIITKDDSALKLDKKDSEELNKILSQYITLGIE